MLINPRLYLPLNRPNESCVLGARCASVFFPTPLPPPPQHTSLETTSVQETGRSASLPKCKMHAKFNWKVREYVALFSYHKVKIHETSFNLGHDLRLYFREPAYAARMKGKVSKSVYDAMFTMNLSVLRIIVTNIHHPFYIRIDLITLFVFSLALLFLFVSINILKSQNTVTDLKIDRWWISLETWVYYFPIHPPPLPISLGSEKYPKVHQEGSRSAPRWLFSAFVFPRCKYFLIPRSGDKFKVCFFPWKQNLNQ